MKFSFSLYEFTLLLPLFKNENLYFCIQKYLKKKYSKTLLMLNDYLLVIFRAWGPLGWGKLICKDSLENKGAPEVS